MQGYVKFNDEQYVSDAPAQLNGNMQSIMTDFSGTSFPVLELYNGMTCFRVDQNKIYRFYENDATEPWHLEYEFVNGGIKAHQAVNDENGKPLASYIAQIVQNPEDAAVLDVFDGKGEKIVSIKTQPDIDLDSVNSIVVDINTQYATGGINEISNNTTWEKVTSPLSDRERCACYGDGVYVIGGTNGDIVISSDARNWQRLTKFTSAVITGVAYGKGRYVAIDSNSNIYTTFDIFSNEWIHSNTDITNILEAITYANGKFVAVFDGGFVAFSNDGLKWDSVASCTTENLFSITSGEGKFVACGFNGTIVSSIDGKYWTDLTNPLDTTQWRTISYGQGKFVVGGAGGKIKTSQDGGKTWASGTTDSVSTVSYIRDIKYLEGKFYAVMYLSSGKGEVWVSSDGLNWKVQYTASGRLWCLGKSDSILFASGDNGSIYILDLDIVWGSKIPSGSNIWSRTVVILNDATRICTDAVAYSFNGEGHIVFPNGSEFWIE